jgi:hypothetical protein
VLLDELCLVLGNAMALADRRGGVWEAPGRRGGMSVVVPTVVTSVDDLAWEGMRHVGHGGSPLRR